MKKLLVLFLGIMITMIGCSKEKVQDKAIEAYMSASQNILNMKSADYNVIMNMTSAIDGETQNMIINLDGSYKADTADIVANMNIDVTADGETQEDLINLYFKDTNLYMNIMGIQKTKTSLATYMALLNVLDWDTYLEENQQSTSIDDIKVLFEEATLENDKLSLITEPEQIKEYVLSILGKNSSYLTESFENVSYKTLTLTATLQDGFFKTVESHIVMTNPDDPTETYDVTLSFSFKNINTVTNITFPDDLDTYEESDESALTDFL